MLSTMDIKTDNPIAVVGQGNTITARLLRQLQPCTVVELTPYQAVMGESDTQRYRAVVVENFEPVASGSLSPCAAARWALARRTELTVVGLDDGEGRRLAAQTNLPVYAYSDGRPQADLTAKYVRLFSDRLEFQALTDQQLVRVSTPLIHGPRLYDYLAALACALALGMPLNETAEKLAVLS